MAILGLKGKVLDAYDGILTIKNKKYDPKENDKKFIGIVYENGDGEILFFHEGLVYIVKYSDSNVQILKEQGFTPLEIGEDIIVDDKKLIGGADFIENPQEVWYGGRVIIFGKPEDIGTMIIVKCDDGCENEIWYVTKEGFFITLYYPENLKVLQKAGLKLIEE